MFRANEIILLGEVVEYALWVLQHVNIELLLDVRINFSANLGN